ncbi:hypothetical protein AGMMS49975_07510 [Clostridia bacterium]|nr:hypothetical protein AGMMS49975_07510 [Clostridia bacterium]
MTNSDDNHLKELAEMFETPLPSLKISVSRIDIETSGVSSGKFIIKNEGGGVLRGKILSNSDAVRFSPETFEGNSAVVTYTAELDVYKAGDIIKSAVVITGNGGEKSLPITIKVCPFYLETKSGERLSSIKDFFKHAQADIENAKNLFVSDDFPKWLGAISYPYIDSYAEIAKDPDITRALDNFFISNRLKAHAYVVPSENIISVTANPYTNEIVRGRIVFQKQLRGFLNVKLLKKHNAPWLTLDKENLTAEDFDYASFADVEYTVDPTRIRSSYSFEEVEAGGSSVKFYVKRLEPFNAYLIKESFHMNERGYIAFDSRVSRKVLVEITTNEPALRFDAFKYELEASSMKMPFVIKLSGVQTAQFMFKQRPYINAEVTVRAESYTKTLKLQIEP